MGLGLYQATMTASDKKRNEAIRKLGLLQKSLERRGIWKYSDTPLAEQKKLKKLLKELGLWAPGQIIGFKA